MPSLSSLIIAFVGGIISFISPCVIPLLPAYLSFLTGLTPEELKEKKKTNQIIVPALLFVLGFTVVFVALGATASVLGSFMRSYQRIFTIVGGALVVIFGVFMTGIIKVPWLYGEKRFNLSKTQFFGRFSGFFMGVAFAAGWTPCIGPVLGSILTLASATSSANQGVVLLLTYSLGLAVPFMLVALMFGYFAPYLRFISRYSVVINRIAGIVLIVVGVLIATNMFGRLSLLLAGYIPSVEVTLPKLH